MFKDQDLTLKKLSTLLGTGDKKLSTLLNANLKTNFYDYINTHRLRYFTDKIAKNKYKNYSIVGLAQESGFKSKSVFYREFKKKFGISPSKYIENQIVPETSKG